MLVSYEEHLCSKSRAPLFLSISFAPFLHRFSCVFRSDLVVPRVNVFMFISFRFGWNSLFSHTCTKQVSTNLKLAVTAMRDYTPWKVPLVFSLQGTRRQHLSYWIPFSTEVLCQQCGPVPSPVVLRVQNIMMLGLCLTPPCLLQLSRG